MSAERPDDDQDSLEAIWIALTIDERGREQLCRLDDDEGGPVPLIAAHHDKLAWIIEQARGLVNLSGQRITVAQFYMRLDITEIVPLEVAGHA